MLRFLALLWHPSVRDAERVAKNLADGIATWGDGWACALRTPGFAAYHARLQAPHQAYVLPGAGVILGTLFRPSTSGQPTCVDPTLDESAVSRMLESDGAHLTDHYWGQYVALLHDPTKRRHQIIRDCSGAVPCFRMQHDGVTIVFSDIADILRLPVRPPTINWRYVSAFLFNDDLRIRECGLNEVTDVLAGERHQIGTHDESLSFHWDPRAVCRGKVIEDVEASISALSGAVQHCVDGWAAKFGNILMNLSGGFDSAVVLGSLARSANRPSMVCLNRYSPAPQEDEREYARLAAQHAGAQLQEVAWPVEGDDLRESLQKAPLTPKPAVTLLGLPDILLRNEIADHLAAEATWTGQGGDHLFFQYRTSLTSADYVRLHGALGAGFMPAIADAVRFSKNSYAAVIRESLKLGYGRKQWKPASATGEQQPFVSRDALPDRIADYVTHPWLANMADLPPAKQLHIWLVADLVNRPLSTARIERAPEHHPLISQPVIEACLCIPTYVLVRGGRHRALARSAFADRVPAAILQRESKGSIRSYLSNTLHRNRALFRELLLDGRLIAEGLLDRKQLEPYVSLAQPLRIEQFFPLLACIAAEIWVRGWAAQAVRKAA